MGRGPDGDIFEIKQRLALIEARLQQLFTHLQVQPLNSPLGSGGGEFSQKVLDLVEQGHKVEAINVHRQEAGLGLAEAKKAIDSL